MGSYKVISLDVTQAGYHRALGELRRRFLGSARKSLDLHGAGGRAKKHQDTGPDGQRCFLSWGSCAMLRHEA